MKTFAPIFLMLLSFSAHANRDDNCKTEAIDAAQSAFSQEFHVAIGTVKRLRTSAKELMSPYYAYAVTINKGANIHGTWNTVLGQQCEIKRVEKEDNGDQAE